MNSLTIRLGALLMLAAGGVALTALARGREDAAPVRSLCCTGELRATQESTDPETLDKAAAQKLLPGSGYSPYADRAYPTRPLFGDTHLHTSQSFDAIAFGCFLGPEEAYRFARGEQIKSSSGQPVRLGRPLDFLVVADHAENMGTMGELKAGNPSLMNDADCKRWNQMLQAGGQEAMKVYYELMASIGGQGKPLPAVLASPEMTRSVWEKNVKAAEKYNDPGRFTALIGYEWSSNTKGNNLHRVVVFRDGADKAGQVLPFSSLTSDKPEDLWKALRSYQEKTGGRVLAIPHNGNLSNGRMFPLINPVGGQAFTRAYAEARSALEPLMEVTQMKGDGETHPRLSPNDEFADFERWDKGNLDLSEDKTTEMLQFEYSRSALKNGLKLERELGINPYKLGMIGSTDAHTGLSAVEEENLFGKLPHAEPSPERAIRPLAKFGDKVILGWEVVSSGYAAVWAAENTRESIWDAMMRRETYATTGPRQIVRFFGGYAFEAKDAHDRMPARVGYAKGVPMGANLPPAPAGKTPTFLVAALKDPVGANLDRYQIIKGWIDAQGDVHERIYDVAVSGGREIGPDGRCQTPVGSTVNVDDASWTNTIGATELIAVWKDPEFDASQLAFYYGRVIEIPTPRWTAYDAKRFGVKMPKGVPMTTTERAYTSPIWYTPPR